MHIKTPKGRIVIYDQLFGTQFGPRYLALNEGGVPIFVNHIFGVYDLTKADYADWYLWAPWGVAARLATYLQKEGREFVKPEYRVELEWDPHEYLVFREGVTRKIVDPGDAIIEEKLPQFLDKVADLLEEYVAAAWYPPESHVLIGGLPVYIDHLFSGDEEEGGYDWFLDSYVVAPKNVISKITHYLSESEEGRSFLKPEYEARYVHEPSFHLVFHEKGKPRALAEPKQAIVEGKWPQFLEKVAEIIGEHARESASL